MKFNALFLTTTIAVLSACGGNKMQSDASTTPHSLQAGEAGLLVYRSQAESEVSAVNIYFDAQYLTSLQRGSYKYLNTCAGAHNIDISDTRLDPAYFIKHSQSPNYTLPEQQITYVRIDGNLAGNLHMEFVPPEQGKAEIASAKEQNHVRSRVINARCK